MDEHKEECLDWIELVCMSPIIAFLVSTLMALLSLLRFLWKAALLFSIAAIHTLFAAVTVTSSILMLRLQEPRINPRVFVRIELQTIVSDFYKIIAPELLLVLSAGVISFCTASGQVFYICMTGAGASILLKWLNTSLGSLGKTAFSFFCDGYGLNSVMFFFSFIGLLDMGGHPVAKCSFTASKAFLFIKDGPNRCDGGNGYRWKEFNRERIVSENESIEFSEWNAFETGLFQLSPRIDFININRGKCILRSFMVLRLLDEFICEYPVEWLELPQDYSKTNELYHFLVDLSSKDGFVTDKIRGYEQGYEHSLTLLEIVEGVEENVGYRIVNPIDDVFVVAGCTDLQHYGHD